MDGAAPDPACLPRIECGTSIDELAAKLIDLCSGNHSAAMVYRFLLKAQDHIEETARAEFVRFLRGELSDRLLQDARRWVQEEQAQAELDGLGREISVRHELPLGGRPQRLPNVNS